MYVGGIQYNFMDLNEMEHNTTFNTAMCLHRWTCVVPIKCNTIYSTDAQCNAAQCNAKCMIQCVCARIIEHVCMVAQTGQMSSAASTLAFPFYKTCTNTHTHTQLRKMGKPPSQVRWVCMCVRLGKNQVWVGRSISGKNVSHEWRDGSIVSI